MMTELEAEIEGLRKELDEKYELVDEFVDELVEECEDLKNG